MKFLLHQSTGRWKSNGKVLLSMVTRQVVDVIKNFIQVREIPVLAMALAW